MRIRKWGKGICEICGIEGDVIFDGVSSLCIDCVDFRKEGRKKA